MSTTEHAPTMEQALTKIKEEFPPKLEELCREMHTRFPLTSYKMPFLQDHTNFFITSAVMGLPSCQKEYSKHNSIVAPMCHKLSKNFRLRLKKACDAYGKFTPVLFPGEEIEKAILYVKASFPKDKAVCDKLFRKEKLSKEEEKFYFEEDLQEIFYIPIKTLENPGDSFSFYGDNPLLVSCMAYHDFSIEIVLRNSQGPVTDRIILVESFFFFGTIRKFACRLYGRIVMGEDIQIEDSPEEISKAEVLSRMGTCPECGEAPHIICNCVYRDSTCHNGHKWYYDKKKNRIRPGHGH